MARSKISKQDHDEALDKLRAMLKPGQTVYCTVRHVAASGMLRRISFFIAYCPNEGDWNYGKDAASIRCIDWLIARACGYMQHDKGGLVVGGCGTDMGFAVVYYLGATLWPDGTPEPHGTRNGEPDSAGGYALKHSWL